MTTDNKVTVRQYGLLAPLDWGDDCKEQLWLENKLWNTLVEIERNNGAQWQAVFEQDAEYAGMKVRLTEIQAAIDAAWEERRKRRSALRSKSGAEDDESADTIKTLAQQRSELWKSMKALRDALKPRYRDELDALEIDRRARVKKARQESGLWWCNYNAVIDDYQTARSRTMKTGGRLNFHAFDGTGRFVNQIQGGLSVDDLFAGRHSQISVAPLSPAALSAQHRGDRKRAQRTTLTVTAYTGRDEAGKHFRRNLTFPMVMHRPIPPNATIKQIEVVARREAGGLRWSVTFTCTEPATSVQHQSPAACGVNLGWRQTSAGVRVATWVDSRGKEGHLYLDDKMTGRLAHCETLQAELDDAINPLRERLALWLQAEDAPEEWRALAESAARSKAPHKLSNLAVAWRAWQWQPEWLAEIEAWRKADKRKRQEMMGLKARALRHRRETYRLFGKRMADDYAIIGIGQLDLKKAAALVVQDNEENTFPAPARRIRQYAAISELAEWLEKQAAKTGSIIATASRPVTDTCSKCGERSPIPADQLVHQCRHCGVVYDRDINAAQIALADAVGGFAQTKEKPERKQKVRKRQLQQPAQGLDT